jgi:uncharacterized membrane protein
MRPPAIIMRDLRLRSDDLVSASPPGAGAWVFPWLPPRGPRTWRLKRNCALTPRQYLGAMGLLMGISALVAAGCWIRGIWLVPVFCGAELVAISAAAFAYACHAIDGETVTLTEDGHVRVDVDRGLKHAAHVLDSRRVRLVRTDANDLWLHQGPVRLEVGRYASASARDGFEAELRKALRQSGG